MEIKVYDTYEEMSQAACDILVSQLLLKPDSNIGLTAGATPVRMYELVLDAFNKGKVSFKDCTLFSLEEMYYPGLTKDHPATIYQELGRQIVQKVDLQPNHFILPDCETTDPEEECRKYTKAIDSLPGGRLDMQVLGIGADAHIGMNTPNETLVGDVHMVDFSNVPAWVEDYKRDFGLPIHYSMAMGVRNILQSRTLLMIANGKGKAQAVHDMVYGNVTTQVPASLLQLHPHAIILLDKEAASLL